MRSGHIAAVLGACLLAGCGSGPGLTPHALESSLAGTFAGLYSLQQSEMGNPVPTRQSLHSTASCEKGTPETSQSGAGPWLCRVTFLVAGPATPVVATYDVNLQTDGCYSAEGDGPASVNGSRTVTGPGYRSRPNPLKLLDSCIDPG